MLNTTVAGEADLCESQALYAAGHRQAYTVIQYGKASLVSRSWRFQMSTTYTISETLC